MKLQNNYRLKFSTYNNYINTYNDNHILKYYYIFHTKIYRLMYHDVTYPEDDNIV